MQIASLLSEQLDHFVVSIIEETLEDFPEQDRESIRKNSAMIAIGGSGRGEVAPYSDADLLFLFRPAIAGLFNQFSKRFVAEFWDAGVKLGQRVHTVNDTIRQALADPHLASSLVHVRGLWGDESLAVQVRHKFYRRCIRWRRNSFVDECIKGREEERTQHGATVQQLEPDVKRSLGGLRDVHLLQWIAFAHHETADLDALRKMDVLSPDDFVHLKAAVEFLMRVRIDLHLTQNRGNDILSKDEQLRIATMREITPVEGQRPVELFMQTYFTHSMAIADITRRFVGRHRPLSAYQVIKRSIVSHRINRHFRLMNNELDVVASRLPSVCTTLEDVVRIYHSAAMYRISLSPRLIEEINRIARNLPSSPTPETSRLFMEILGTTGRLAETIRGMHETNILELIIPEWHRVRCLLQFNQYHHFTVDEHTLQCIEVCEGFMEEDSPTGAALRNIDEPELLFLALLLHDSGKGFDEEHSEVGRRISEDVGQRLRLSVRQRDIVGFLVHQHLKMADLAFRHDTSDERVVLTFAHQVGTTEKLRMLYVLTAADVSGVGPGVWNNWKADLLTDFYKRLMLTLSGQPPSFHEEERLGAVRDHVYKSIVPLEPESDEVSHSFKKWIDRQLDSFSSHYLSFTSPARIATDLDVIRSLESGEIQVEARLDRESQTVDYRIITDQHHSSGCFHLIAGVLAAMRLEILRAEITTTTDGVVVDVFHVRDHDFELEVPRSRTKAVADAIRDVLTGGDTVEELFRRHKRFSCGQSTEAVMELPTRVEVDDHTSDRCTVISVFVHDQPGLLYTISRTLFQLGLSIELAKISTHFDQVADVFYVTDNDGRKIRSESDQDAIRIRLEQELAAFEASTHREFVS